MWPISKRVNTPKNDDPSLLDVMEEAAWTSYARGDHQASKRAFLDPCSRGRVGLRTLIQHRLPSGIAPRQQVIGGSCVVA
jgi:hypothetical protein